MASKVSIKICNENVNRNQDQALAATIYILREYGPTGFLLKEENEEKNFKIYLGQEHNCSCSAFQKTKELCKHICWLLLKKFKVPRDDSLCWKKGLNEREINGLLYGKIRTTKAKNSEASSTQDAVGAEEGKEITDGCIEQRSIGEDCVCPICLDNLLNSHQPVTYCRYGCGNNIHIKCMKIHAIHQKSNDKETITCPMCRASFISLETLRKEERNSMNGVSRPVKCYHQGITCDVCCVKPIVGNCYKCVSCTSYHLCQACFNTPIHQEHSFKFRQKKIQKWQSAFRNFGYSLPNAMVNNLMGRELKSEDYDTLLNLDSENVQEFTSLPEKVIDSLPLETLAEHSPLLAQGAQCQVCLQRFHLYQPVRKLPCRHKFHRECIDNWLLHCHAVCPVDGEEVWNPSTTAKKKCKKKLKKEENILTKETLALDITGCSLKPSQFKRPAFVGIKRLKSLHLERTLGNEPGMQDLLLNGTSVLLGQSQSIRSDEADKASVSRNSNKDDYFGVKTTSLTNLVTRQCSAEVQSSATRIKGGRRESVISPDIQRQRGCERVNSAPVLNRTPNVLPPIQVKGCSQASTRKMSSAKKIRQNLSATKTQSCSEFGEARTNQNATFVP